MQKTTFKTRLLALLTAAFMIVMCVPFAAFAANETKTIHVKFINDANDEIAAGYDLTETNNVNNVAGDVYSGKCPDGQVLDHWTYGNKEFAKGAELTFAELDAIIGDNYTTDTHECWVNFVASFKPEQEPVTLQKIVVAFKDAQGNDVAAGYTLTAGQTNSVAGDVYPTACPEGKELDSWTFSGKTFAKGADVTFEKLADIIGNNYTDEGVSYVTFVPEFKDKAVEPTPVTLQKIVVAFKDAQGNDVAAGYTLTAGQTNSVAGDVYPTACPEGKELDFWTFSGKTFAKGADVTFEKLADIIGNNYTDEGVSYVTFVPEFKDKAVEPEQPEAPKHHFNVYFTVDPEKGSFTEYGAGPVEFKGNEEEVGDYQYKIPAVTAKEGYKFVGWKGQGASEIAWDADAKTFGVSGLCFYENGKYDGYASIEAVFEPTVKLTDIKVNFVKEDGKTVVSAAQYIAKDATLVLPYDVEGVIGWKLANNLTTYDVKTKFSFNDLAAFVGTNYAANGTAELTFYAQYKTEVELKNITIKYVEDKDGAQEDVAAPQNNFTAKDEFTILTDSLYNGKVPAGKKLIGWQYKNGGKTTNFVKGEHVKFDTLKALLNGNWDNEGNAWVTLTPVFQDVKTDSTSASTSSSSNTTNTSASNTTNTSASQKQVVKAAAAPANTTKVLPKTGATNAAPLIGGSLAVVALLMGYGVYGLVLRKKD